MVDKDVAVRLSNLGELPPHIIAGLRDLGLLVDSQNRDMSFSDVILGNAMHGVSLVVLHVTDQCNLRCKHCYAECESTSNRRMSADVLHRVTEWLRDSESLRMHIQFHGGEPLLELEAIEEIIPRFRDIADDKGISHKFSIQTNGTIITPTIAKRLADLNVEVGVSIDHKDDTLRMYESGKGSFGDALRGLCTLRDAGLSPGVITIVTKENYRRIRELLQMLSDLGVQGVKLNPFIPAGRGRTSLESYGLSSNEYATSMKAAIDFVIGQMQTKRRLRVLPLMHMIQNLSLKKRAYMCMRSPCGAAIEQVCIDTNGDVHVCSLKLSTNPSVSFY